jgi:hypothetical protein
MRPGTAVTFQERPNYRYMAARFWKSSRRADRAWIVVWPLIPWDEPYPLLVSRRGLCPDLNLRPDTYELPDWAQGG